MLDFSERSVQPELMDSPGNYSDEVMANTYKEINFINKYLLGDYFILQDVLRVAKSIKKREIAILDLGCGNGDLLYKLKSFLKSKGIIMKGIGYDPYLKTTGQHSTPEHSVFLYDDWDKLKAAHTIDLSVTSLTLHHLYGEELKIALHRLIDTPICGFVISDLMRNKLAYRLIQCLTHLFSHSELVKHDAPLSVWRAFSKKDMESMLVSASKVATCSLRSTISFRWMLTGIKAGCV